MLTLLKPSPLSMYIAVFQDPAQLVHTIVFFYLSFNYIITRDEFIMTSMAIHKGTKLSTLKSSMCSTVMNH